MKLSAASRYATIRPTTERSDLRGVGGHAAPALHASPRPRLVRHTRVPLGPGTRHACDRGPPAPRPA
jgi:hypothetical protein